MCFSLNAQRFKNLKASYVNDTLCIRYDVENEKKIDSLEVEISSAETGKKYLFSFNISKTGKSSRLAKKYIPRDSFPLEGEQLKIRLKGYIDTGNSPKNRKFRYGGAGKINFKFLKKEPVDPRFSMIMNGGLIMPSEEFSEGGLNSSFSFHYNPVKKSSIGLGVNYFNFKDSIKSYTTVSPFISTRYYHSDFPFYMLVNYGYCSLNSGAVLGVGGGFIRRIRGPFLINFGAQIQKHYGDYSFVSVLINAGLQIDGSIRKRKFKDRVYRFKNMVGHLNGSFNYLNDFSTGFGLDASYKISPLYFQGLGISFENVNYKFKPDIAMSYYSSYYQEQREYIFGGFTYNLKIKIIPVYLCGRLYLSKQKNRPFLLWKYGVTLFSSVNKGVLDNGFFGDLGIGMQIPLNKTTAFTFSGGVKYFDNKYSIGNIENNIFGTFYLNTGIVFNRLRF